MAQVAVDLRDSAAVRAAMAEVQPSLVIHAAYAMDQRSIVEATRNVVDASTAIGARVLYVSTDAVFSGDGTLVSESSSPRPVWDYGRWKLDAEKLVLASSGLAAVVRLPLVVSLDPADATASRVARDGESGATKWYNDEFRQPAMALDIAEAIWRIADLSPRERHGIWHLPGPERLSRSNIALRYARSLGTETPAVDSVPTPPGAHRPLDIWMSDQRAQDRIGWQPSKILL